MAAKSSDLAIAAKQLTKKFGDKIAVYHVSFEISHGQIFSLLGPNDYHRFDH
jgi:ABC-2 type transport system ATP-binding protein